MAPAMVRMASVGYATPSRCHRSVDHTRKNTLLLLYAVPWTGRAQMFIIVEFGWGVKVECTCPHNALRASRLRHRVRKHGASQMPVRVYDWAV